MSDIIRKLTESEDVQIETGFVNKYLGRSKYSVNVNGVKRVLRSAVREKIFAGERVVINKLGQDRYIIGTTRQLQTRGSKEIVVE